MRYFICRCILGKSNLMTCPFILNANTAKLTSPFVQIKQLSLMSLTLNVSSFLVASEKNDEKIKLLS